MDCDSFRPNPRGEAWLNSSDNFGRRMLEKQGWTDGKGLGAKEQGMRECIRVSQKQNRHGFGRNVAEESATALRKCHDSFADILANLQTLHAQSDQAESRSASEDCGDAAETASEGEEKRRRKRERKEKRKRRREEEQAESAVDSGASEKNAEASPIRTGETLGRSASAMSLYEVASRRKLIHYARYTRSKDVARLTGEDFRGVFGKSTESAVIRNEPVEPPQPVAVPTPKSDEPQAPAPSEPSEPTGTPLFKSEKTVAEYFAEKKRLKAMQAN